jgi:hypothetical protein
LCQKLIARRLHRTIIELTFYMEGARRYSHSILPYRLPMCIRVPAPEQEKNVSIIHSQSARGTTVVGSLPSPRIAPQYRKPLCGRSVKRYNTVRPPGAQVSKRFWPRCHAGA